MSQISIFNDDNLRSDLLRFISNEKRLRERRLRRNNSHGSFDEHSKGYLDCLDTMEYKIKSTGE